MFFCIHQMSVIAFAFAMEFHWNAFEYAIDVLSIGILPGSILINDLVVSCYCNRKKTYCYFIFSFECGRWWWKCTFALVFVTFVGESVIKTSNLDWFFSYLLVLCVCYVSMMIAANAFRASKHLYRRNNYLNCKLFIGLDFLYTNCLQLN